MMDDALLIAFLADARRIDILLPMRAMVYLSMAAEASLSLMQLRLRLPYEGISAKLTAAISMRRRCYYDDAASADAGMPSAMMTFIAIDLLPRRHELMSCVQMLHCQRFFIFHLSCLS